MQSSVKLYNFTLKILSVACVGVPQVWVPLFGRTCWTCLNLPLQLKYMYYYYDEIKTMASVSWPFALVAYALQSPIYDFYLSFNRWREEVIALESQKKVLEFKSPPGQKWFENFSSRAPSSRLSYNDTGRVHCRVGGKMRRRGRWHATRYHYLPRLRKV